MSGEQSVSSIRLEELAEAQAIATTWITNAPAIRMAVMVLDLVEQLQAPCRCDKCRDCVAADGYERLQEQFETLRSTLEAADDLLGNVYAKSDEHAEKLMRVRVRVLSALKVSFPASEPKSAIDHD